MKVSQMQMDPSGPEFRRVLRARQASLQTLLATKTPAELMAFIGTDLLRSIDEAADRRVLRRAYSVATLAPDSEEGRRDMAFLRRKAFEYGVQVAGIAGAHAYEAGDDYGAAQLAAYERFL